MSNEIYLDFVDFEGNKIILNDYYYHHIIDKRGSEITKYHQNWIDTLKYPDYIGNSKSHPGCKIYVQERNKNRKFLSNFLIIVVNEANLITSIRFGKNLNFIKNLKEMEK